LRRINVCERLISNENAHGANWRFVIDCHPETDGPSVNVKISMVHGTVKHYFPLPSSRSTTTMEVFRNLQTRASNLSPGGGGVASLKIEQIRMTETACRLLCPSASPRRADPTNDQPGRRSTCKSSIP
jgi:hypothetical protein